MASPSTPPASGGPAAEAATPSQAAPAIQWPRAIAIFGGTGAGKSSQLYSLKAAAAAQGLELVVACFDTGSLNQHETAGGRLAPLAPIRELVRQFPEEKYLLAIDNWTGYESWSVLKVKRGDAPVPLKTWNSIVGGFRDDLTLAFGRRNLVLVANLSSSDRPVPTLGEDGQQTSRVIPRGSIICTPALEKTQALGAGAPIVLPISSGGGDSPSPAWVLRQLGAVARKFSRRTPEGVSFNFPGHDGQGKTVSVDQVSLGDIWTSLIVRS